MSTNLVGKSNPTIHVTKVVSILIVCGWKETDSPLTIMAFDFTILLIALPHDKFISQIKTN